MCFGGRLGVPELEQDIGVRQTAIQLSDEIEEGLVAAQLLADPATLVWVVPQVGLTGLVPQLGEFSFFLIEVKGTSWLRAAASAILRCRTSRQRRP